MSLLALLFFLIGLFIVKVVRRRFYRKIEQLRADKLTAALFCLGEVVGRDKSEILATLGSAEQHGVMDFGEEVYQWRVQNFYIELWFKNQICFRKRLLNTPFGC